MLKHVYTLLFGVNLKRVSQFKYLDHYETDDLKNQIDVGMEQRALAVRPKMLAVCTLYMQR